MFEPALDVLVIFVAGAAFVVLATFASVKAVLAEFEVLATGAVVLLPPDVVCKTETFPVMAGNESNKAEIMKITAAVIVILDKTDCVPRGPKAVLEILLVKSAPASVLPGCKSTVAIKTKHEIKNNP